MRASGLYSGVLRIEEVAQRDVRARRQGVDVLLHDLGVAISAVVVQRAELEQRDRLGEVEVLAHDLVLQHLARLEDVGADEVGLVVLLEQCATVREDHRVVVDVDDPGLGVDSLRDLVGVLRGGQSRAAVEELA